jgi:hypothetical protein
MAVVEMINRYFSEMEGVISSMAGGAPVHR